ncbi:unnamed protein product, partial [marine sediment metagenome]
PTEAIGQKNLTKFMPSCKGLTIQARASLKNARI